MKKMKVYSGYSIGEAMKFKIVINEVWQAEHLVEADSAEEAEELADLTDDFLVERHFISNQEDTNK